MARIVGKTGVTLAGGFGVYILPHVPRTASGASVIGGTFYRTAAQTIARNTWTNVTFQAAQYDPLTYGTPVMWTSGTDISIPVDGLYYLMASLGFTDPPDVSYFGCRFRSIAKGVLGGKGRAYFVGGFYTQWLQAEGLYRLTAGDAVRLQVVHNATTSESLNAGIANSGFSVMKVD